MREAAEENDKKQRVITCVESLIMRALDNMHVKTVSYLLCRVPNDMLHVLRVWIHNTYTLVFILLVH